MTYFPTISTCLAKGRAVLPTSSVEFVAATGQVPIRLARVGVQTVSIVGGGSENFSDIYPVYTDGPFRYQKGEPGNYYYL